MLDNPRSERIKKVATLSGRSVRKKTGRILVEGPGAVQELLRFRPEAVVDVYLTEDAELKNPGIGDLANSTTSWVHQITPEVATKISQEAQGVLAVAESSAISGFAAGETLAKGFWVLLPETQDPGNLGTIIRTADAMGAKGVLVGEGTCEVANPKVIRSSAGSVFHLPIVSTGFAEAIDRFRSAGVTTLATALRADSVALTDLISNNNGPLYGPHAWVFGNEARGLDSSSLAQCDRLVHIPMVGDAESLNVASAAAMCMFASLQCFEKTN